MQGVPRAAVFRAVILAASALAVAAGLWCFDPEKAPWIPACPFHVLTGLLCPGCGTLRCLHQMAHGHLAHAVAFNPLVVAAVPLVLCSLVVELCELLGRRPPGRLVFPARAYWFTTALIVGFGIARNIG